MRKLLLLLLIVCASLSCSKDSDCSYRGEREDDILEQMAEIKEKMKDAPGEVKKLYEGHLDILQKELTYELGICD